MKFRYWGRLNNFVTVVHVDHALVLVLVLHTQKAHVQVAALHVGVVVCRLVLDFKFGDFFNQDSISCFYVVIAEEVQLSASLFEKSIDGRL